LIVLASRLYPASNIRRPVCDSPAGRESGISSTSRLRADMSVHIDNTSSVARKRPPRNQVGPARNSVPNSDLNSHHTTSNCWRWQRATQQQPTDDPAYTRRHVGVQPNDRSHNLVTAPASASRSRITRRSQPQPEPLARHQLNPRLLTGEVDFQLPRRSQTTVTIIRK
jgi:hypothetical protein